MSKERTIYNSVHMQGMLSGSEMFTWLLPYPYVPNAEYHRCAAAAAKSLQLYPTLSDGRPSGSPIPGILQARTLEWVAMPSSRGSSPPRDRTLSCYVSCIGRWVPYH